MQIGIFSRTFDRPSLDGVLDAVAAHGLTDIHFNLNAAGVDSLPEEITDSLCHGIRNAFDQRGLTMVSVSGTFNMIHPNQAHRHAGIRRACHLVDRCRHFGTSMVSLCTGSRNAENMWQRHPDNEKADAWADLVAALRPLLVVAESCGVTLGVEPERGTVVNSAPKARRLLDQMHSSALKIIIDGANFVDGDDLSGMHSVLEEAFDLLGAELVTVHAKDISDDATKKDQAAGTGRLDWGTYFRLLKRIEYDGPVILHNLREDQVDSSLSFARLHLAKWYPEMRGND